MTWLWFFPLPGPDFFGFISLFEIETLLTVIWIKHWSEFFPVFIISWKFWCLSWKISALEQLGSFQRTQSIALRHRCTYSQPFFLSGNMGYDASAGNLLNMIFWTFKIIRTGNEKENVLLKTEYKFRIEGRKMKFYYGSNCIFQKTKINFFLPYSIEKIINLNFCPLLCLLHFQMQSQFVKLKAETILVINDIDIVNFNLIYMKADKMGIIYCNDIWRIQCFVWLKSLCSYKLK